MALLNIHILESVLALLSQELVVECFLKVDSFEVKYGDNALVIASVADCVVSVSALGVYVYFLVDDVLWGSKLCEKV